MKNQGNTSGMLDAERLQCSFDIDEMMTLLGSKQKRIATENAKKLFETAPFSAQFNRTEDYASYQEHYLHSIQRTSEAVKITRENPKFMMEHAAGKVQMGDLFETNGVAAIHFTMFLTFLKTNASKEQKAVWLDGAQEARYFGAYAQTELGHGSNLRGLETVATFDVDKDEFIVDSPTLTSMKFWPTGMYACTHCVCFANLYLDGKNHGIQAFMLQLRDQDGKLMPGVEVGETGPKIIGGHTNIGYARFDRVRIPRFNMFQKLSKVTREGKFIAPPPKQGKVKNISMMMMRVFNVEWAARDTSKAATIAIRYSMVRRQGFKDTTIDDGKTLGEHVVMDYSMQQYRLFKTLAIAYMFAFNSMFLTDYLQGVQTKINIGDESAADELPELHATISGLKVFSTVVGHENIEECRKACGGQGFLRQSGIADLSNSFSEPVTVEGEQVILSLQVARFLIKSVKSVKKGEAPLGSATYLLKDSFDARELDLTSNQCLVDLFEDRARRVAFKLEAKFSAAVDSGRSFDEATNYCAILGYKSAQCHASYTMVRNFYHAISKYALNPKIQLVLWRLFQLQALVQIRENFGDWMTVFQDQHMDLCLERIEIVLKEIRPDAIGLVDAFGHTDDSLRSTLGRYDGNVYEAIYQQAKDSPLNKSEIMIGWEHLKEILDIDFLKRGIGQRHISDSKL